MGNKLDQEFLSQAIAIAIDNIRQGKGGPFGAVIVKDGKIIATGANYVTTQNDPTAHAEITAIRNACKALGSYQLTDCIIYSSCEPCPMCLGAIYWARPAKIVYASTRWDAANAGFDDSLIYNEINIPIAKRKIPTVYIKIEETKKLFYEWGKMEKTEY
ncbi:MAG: nucleoside deaminase [Lentimicrobiaceae bacterium]|nr:nucleoside deaminase [Lentimicrobiaceae bacterium]